MLANKLPKNLIYISGIYFLSPWVNAASPATTNFAVSATIIDSCIVAATPLAFGNYDPTSGSPLTGTNTVTVTCTLATPFTIALDAGLGSGATVTTRKMTRILGGTQTLNYSLYQDSGHGTVWGTSGGALVSSTGTGLPVPFTVFGQVTAGQASPAAAYGDTIGVTVAY